MSKGKKGGEAKSPYDLIRGKEVVFQLLRGTIIEGLFAGIHDNYFMLTNAEIKGKNNICKTDLVFVNKTQVQHFHLKGEVTPKNK